MWVVDAGVAIKWFVNEAGSDRADLVLEKGARLFAPDLALAEIANGLRRKERMNALSAEATLKAIEVLPRLFQSLIPCYSHICEATRLSQELDHSVYDCLYLAVARALNAPLITADGKFTMKLAGTVYAANAVLLADWTG